MFSFHSVNSINEELNVDIDVSPIDSFLYKYQTNQTDGFRRSQILNGVYYRDKVSFTNIDISVDNYPNSINEFDTNNGLSWKQNKGIANITLSGSSVNSDNMPIVSNNSTTSFVDLIHILKFYLGLEELKMNLTGNNEKLLIDKVSSNDSIDTNVSVIEKNFTQNILTPTTDNYQNSVYISLSKSSPTKWCRVKFISVEIENIDFCNNSVSGISIKLIIDGVYLSRLSINTQPNTINSLLIWNEKPIPSNYLNDLEKYSECQYLKNLRKQDSPNILIKIIQSDNPRKIGLSSKSFSYISEPIKMVKDYIYFSYTKEIFKIVEKDFKDNILWIETLIPISPTKPNDTVVISFVDKKYLELYEPEIFMVDYIRDRFAIFLFIATLANINKNQFTESFLSLVKRLSGVYVFNDLLYYYNLIEFYNVKTNHCTEYMLKIFNFICDNMYFYSPNKNIDIAGTVLSDVYSTDYRMNINNYERLSGINTDLNIEYPEDWCHMNKLTESGKTLSLNTTCKSGFKKILFKNYPFFKNKNYCILIKYSD